MGNYLSLIQTKQHYFNYQKHNTDTVNLTKLIWYDIDIEENEKIIDIEDNLNSIVYIDIIESDLDLDIYTNLIYNNLIILIKSNSINLNSYKIIKDYIVKYNVKFNELLEKRCMCYFLYWELRPFLSESDNKELLYIFTRFQNRFGWYFNDTRY